MDVRDLDCTPKLEASGARRVIELKGSAKNLELPERGSALRVLPVRQPGLTDSAIGPSSERDRFELGL